MFDPADSCLQCICRLAGMHLPPSSDLQNNMQI
jgi:hypothetical protein